LLLVGIQVPPSKRFSRLQEEQNLSDCEAGSVACILVSVVVLVVVVIVNLEQQNLYFNTDSKALQLRAWNHLNRFSSFIPVEIKPVLIFEVI